MDMTKGFHVLEKSTDTPPFHGRGEEYIDAHGNKFRLCFHKTDTAGVAIDAGGPVGYKTGSDEQIITGDISQSNADRVLGASMVALTAAETLAGIWHWVLIEGSLVEYMTDGAEVPIGDSAPSNSFTYTSPYAPIDTIPYEAAGCVLNQRLIWSGDNEWNDSAGVATEVYAGLALVTEASATPAADAFRFGTRY